MKRLKALKATNHNHNTSTTCTHSPPSSSRPAHQIGPFPGCCGRRNANPSLPHQQRQRRKRVIVLSIAIGVPIFLVVLLTELQLLRHVYKVKQREQQRHSGLLLGLWDHTSGTSSSSLLVDRDKNDKSQYYSFPNATLALLGNNNNINDHIKRPEMPAQYKLPPLVFQQPPQQQQQLLSKVAYEVDDETDEEEEDGPYKLPPMETLFDTTTNNNRTVLLDNADPSILLQYSIVGFGKCGTTTVNDWLRQHPQLQALQSEVWALPMDDPGRLMSRLYRKLKSPTKQRGYKCPGNLLSHIALRYYQQYWPTSKMLVGLRHPVAWFHSLYNFRVQNYKEFHLHPNELVGATCLNGPDSKLTCTMRGFYAYYLMQLGKQYVSRDSTTEQLLYTPRRLTELERNISNWHGKQYHLKRKDILDLRYNDVFLWHVEQLAIPDDNDDTNETRQQHQQLQQLRRDLEQFMGLTVPLPEYPQRRSPGRPVASAHIQADKDKRKITDICSDEYISVRRELVSMGRLSALWIKQEFLGRPGVYVSSREQFEQLLDMWQYDPCDKKNNDKKKKKDKEDEEDVDGGSLPEDDTLTDAALAAAVLGASTTRLQVHSNSTSIINSSYNAHARPPLDSILDNQGNIIGDPQFLLDFAIIGFGKCGTSTVLHWLNTSPETACLSEEIWALMVRDPARLVTTLYNELPADDIIDENNNNINNTNVHPKKYKRCTKCPLDITQWHILDYYRVLWPRTKLIVGVRHPILWFQSLFNFRVQTLSDYADLIHPNEMIGLCGRRQKMVCTRKGNFAAFLMRLGKQYHPNIINNNVTATNGHRRHHRKPRFTKLEDKIANWYAKDGFERSDVTYMPNDVFIYELGQLADDEEEANASSRKRDFGTALQQFLGLEHALDNVVRITPTKAWNNATAQALRDARKIDICQDEYLPVRRELLSLARASSEWIRTVFLDLPEVHCANREHLEELLLTWMHDPCGTTKTDTVTQAELDAIVLATKTGRTKTDADLQSEMDAFRLGASTANTE